MEKEREKNQINKIRNEDGGIPIGSTGIQRIIRENYQELCVIKMDELEDMDKFLEGYNFPKLKQEKMESLNRHVTHREIKTVIRNFTANKTPRPESFTAEFYLLFQE